MSPLVFRSDCAENQSSFEIVLDRFQTKISRRPRVSNGKDADGLYTKTWITNKKAALKRAEIQVNNSTFINYMMYDIDSPTAAFAWEDGIGIPRPTIIAVNPKNGHAHYFYELEEPIRLSEPVGGRYDGPVWFYKVVQEALRTALSAKGADSGYNGGMAHNPCYAGTGGPGSLLRSRTGGPGWQVICYDRTYTLRELSEHLDLPDAAQRLSPGRSAVLHQDQEGRNCTLFHSLRYWAYRAVRQYQDREDFTTAAMDQLDHLNEGFKDHPKGPLNRQELSWICQSVVRFTWKMRSRSYQELKPRSKGPLQLDDSIPLNQRQRIGQAHVVQTRVERTRSKIVDAMTQLHDQGIAITKSAVHKLVAGSRMTIDKHWNIVFDSFNSSSSSTVNVPVIDPVVLPLRSTPSKSVTESYFSPLSLETVSLRDDSRVSPPSGEGVGTTPLIPEGNTPNCTCQNSTKPTIPARIAFLIPAGGPTTSQEVLSYSQVIETFHKGTEPTRVLGMLAALQYADYMAASGILIDGLPDNTRHRLMTQINQELERHAA